MTAPRPEERTFTCRLGRPLAYFQAGTGSDLVIVNAYGVAAALWDDVVEALSRDHRILVWNLRGFAETERDLRFTLADHAADLVEILDHAGSRRTHVLAYCSGTKVSLLAMRQLAGRVRSLAFLGGNFWPIPGYGPIRSRFAGNLHKLAQMIRKRPFMAPVVVTMMKGKVVALPMVAENLSLIPEAYRDLVVAPYSSKEAVRTYAELVCAYYETDTTPLLAELDVPVLVIEGRADTVVDPDLSAAVAGRLPQAAHEIVPDFNHFCMIVEPDRLAALAGGFAAQVEAAETSRLVPPLPHDEPARSHA